VDAASPNATHARMHRFEPSPAADAPSVSPPAAAPAGRRAGAWRRAAAPLLGAVWIAALLAPILQPGRALANRDILLFHLPLVTCFRTLVAGGALPEWNPWLNGGQPILSNPSYSSFYLPTWLVLPLPPIYAISLSVAFHLALAFAGAWYCARRLGAGRAAAALAAVGFAGSGGLMSLVSSFNLLRGMCWIPWVLGLGAAMFDGDAAAASWRRRAWLRPALLCALALGMAMLNGEPSMILLSCLGLAALAAAELRRRPAAALRLLVPVVFALLLATVQLWPTAARLAGGARGEGLPEAESTHWSMPPARLVELAFPHFFGDPSRNMVGLFFGHNVHDLEYPYVLSLYPGLLVSVLALAALAAWPIPRRVALLLTLAAAMFLALGRHNPLYVPLLHVLRPLAAQRFPERFVVLALTALVFAAALGWQHLLDRRRAGHPEIADLPLTLSLVVLAVALLLAGLLYQYPAMALVFLREHSLPGNETPRNFARGLLFLRQEGWWSLATAGATAALFALCRWRRPHPALLSALAVLLLGADLWRAGHGLVRTLPAAEYQHEPEILRQLAAPNARIFVEEMPGHLLPLPGTPPDRDIALAHHLLDGAAPYSAAIWQVDYALNYDFDRMVTRAGTTILKVLRADLHRQPEMAMRLIGAWAVDRMLLRAATARGEPEPLDESNHGLGQVVAVSAGKVDTPSVVVRNSNRLPFYRFVPTVSFYPDYEAALYAARGQGYAVDRHEHCLRRGQPAATVRFASPPRPLAFHPAASRFDLRYRTPDGGFFVVAVTFDDGWRATIDGAPATVYQTAACQLGVALPPGEHQLALVYHDRSLPPAAAVSLAALGLWLVLLVGAPPMPPRPASAPISAAPSLPTPVAPPLPTLPTAAPPARDRDAAAAPR
jgi:hypothetical protein